MPCIGTQRQKSYRVSTQSERVKWDDVKYAPDNCEWFLSGRHKMEQCVCFFAVVILSTVLRIYINQFCRFIYRTIFKIYYQNFKQNILHFKINISTYRQPQNLGPCFHHKTKFYKMGHIILWVAIFVANRFKINNFCPIQ